MSPNAKWTKTQDGKFWTYFIEPQTEPAPCVLCGQPPAPDEKVLETMQGEPRLLCSRCVDTANSGFYDLDLLTSAGCILLRSTEQPPW